MSRCEMLDLYLDRRLDDSQNKMFEEHLATCPACKEALSQWGDIEQRLQSWAQIPERESVASKVNFEINTLMQKANQATEQKFWSPYLAWGTILFFAVALFSLPFIFKYSSSGDNKAAGEIVATLSIGNSPLPPEEKTLHVGNILAAPSERPLVAQLERDKLRLAPRSRVRFLRIKKHQLSLKLERGELACAVAKRKSVGQFVVKARRYHIQVVGTQFTVRLAALSSIVVSVNEGIVDVRDEKHPPTRIVAGEKVNFTEDGAVHRETLAVVQRHDQDTSTKDKDDQPQNVPGNEVWYRPNKSKHHKVKRTSKSESRAQPKTKSSLQDQTQLLENFEQMILEGQLNAAALKITRYLNQFPTDHRAWMQLATCLRKTKQWRESVKAYQKVIRLAPLAQANRARFLAASLFQDQLNRPGEAKLLLEQYLSTHRTSPARAEAMYRLAKALLALGEKSKARKLLQTLIAEQGRTPISIRSRELLRKIKN